MRFTVNSLTLGSEGLSSARARNGDVVFIVRRGGSLVSKTLPSGGSMLSAGEVISYADECYLLDSGKLEKRGGYEYESY